jgi:hypothetical protein
MSNSRGIIHIGLTDPKQVNTNKRLQKLINDFNALDVAYFDSLQNTFFEPATDDIRAAFVEETKGILFGTTNYEKCKDKPGMQHFTAECDAAKSKPATWAIWLENRAIDQLKDIFADQVDEEYDAEDGDDANQALTTATDSWHLIDALKAMSSKAREKCMPDNKAVAITRAYSALVLAAIYGSGRAAKLLTDSCLIQDLFNFDALGHARLSTHQLRIAQVSYFVTLHTPAFVLTDSAVAPTPEQIAISKLQSLNGITKYLADWQSEVSNPKDNSTYLMILTLLKKAQEWLPPREPSIQAASDYLLRKDTGTLNPDVAELADIQKMCLALLVELAPSASQVMTRQIANQKVATVDMMQQQLNALTGKQAAAQKAHDDMVHPHDRRYPTKLLMTKPFSEINEQTKKDRLVSEYNADMTAHNEAIEAATNAVAEFTTAHFNPTKASYDAVVENFSVNDPILVVVRMLLQAIENGIFSFAKVPTLLVANNLDASSGHTVAREEVEIIKVLERFLSQNKKTFTPKKGGEPKLPPSLSMSNDYLPLHQITADTSRNPEDRVRKFKERLEGKLYQNGEASSKKGTVAQSATANEGSDILLQHPMIATYFLVRILNLDFRYKKNSRLTPDQQRADKGQQRLAYGEVIPGKIINAKNQIFVAVQNIEATLNTDTTDDFAITLRNYLLISAALLLDPKAIMTLRYEASSNPLALEGIAISADFNDTIKRVGSAEPCYEDALALLAQFKATVASHAVYQDLHKSLASVSLNSFIGQKNQQGELIDNSMIKRDYLALTQSTPTMHSRQDSQESQPRSLRAASKTSSSEDGLLGGRIPSTDSSDGMKRSAESLVESKSPSLFGDEEAPAAVVNGAPGLVATAAVDDGV